MNAFSSFFLLFLFALLRGRLRRNVSCGLDTWNDRGCVCTLTVNRKIYKIIPAMTSQSKPCSCDSYAAVCLSPEPSHNLTLAQLTAQALRIRGPLQSIQV